MSEYRITVGMSEHGARDVFEKNMEKLADAFEETAPEAGAAFGANLVTGVLEVTFALDAESAQEAWDLGATVFGDGAGAADLPVTEVTSITVEKVLAEELAEDRELVPA